MNVDKMKQDVFLIGGSCCFVGKYTTLSLHLMYYYYLWSENNCYWIFRWTAWCMGLKVRGRWWHQSKNYMKNRFIFDFLIIKLLYFVLCLLKYIASNSIWQFWMLVDVLLNCVAWLEAHSISTFYIPKYKLKWNSLSIFAADHPKEPNFCPRSKSDSTCKSYWWMGQSVKYHQCCWQWVRLASVADTALN